MPTTTTFPFLKRKLSSEGFYHLLDPNIEAIILLFPSLLPQRMNPFCSCWSLTGRQGLSQEASMRVPQRNPVPWRTTQSTITVLAASRGWRGQYNLVYMWLVKLRLLSRIRVVSYLSCRHPKSSTTRTRKTVSLSGSSARKPNELPMRKRMLPKSRLLAEEQILPDNLTVNQPERASCGTRRQFEVRGHLMCVTLCVCVWVCASVCQCVSA